MSLKIIRIQSRICLGGPALHTILLTAHLNREKFRTILVGGALEPGEGDISFWAESNNVTFTQIEQMGRDIFFLKDMFALIKLYRLIKREKPQIVHTHTAKAGALGRLAAWLARVPHIYHTFHGHTFSGYFNVFVTRAIIFLERLLAKVTTRIIVISASQQEEICQRFKITEKKKTKIIPLGYDFSKLAQPAGGFLENFAPVHRNKLKIGAIGRLVPVKDHRLLLDAFALVKQKKNVNGTVLFIVGDGELKNELRNYSERLGLHNDVIFTGSISNIQDVYDDLDLVVLTSKNEGTPVSLIEAMYHGVPILATEVGGVKDIVPDSCGVLVKNRHPQDLAFALNRMIIDREYRNSFRNRGREYVLENFSAKRLVRDIEALYLNEAHQ